MTFMLGAVLVALILILLPRAGLAAYWKQRRAAVGRQRAEDALKHLLSEEYRGRHGSFSSLAGTLRLADATIMGLVERLENQGLIQTQGAQFHLTPAGERVALQVVRAHRLWERYLADEARLPLGQLHEEAERREHSLTPEQVDRLDASLGHPPRDPHGDPIPTADGYLEPATGSPMTDWPTGTPGRIVHLEDEPPLAFSQIVAEGFRVGQVVRVLEATPERILFSDGEREYRLAPAVAANVFVAEVMGSPPVESGVRPLSTLAPGTPAEVVRLDDACQGFTRRRLLDLGFTTGARLQSELDTFAGDPRAYRIRGTLVALRRDQAAQILVTPMDAEATDTAAALAARGTGGDASANDEVRP